MTKQVRMGGGGKGDVGEFGFTETLKHFFVLKIPEILIGRKVYIYSSLLLDKYVCMSLQRKSLKNVVGNGA